MMDLLRIPKPSRGDSTFHAIAADAERLSRHPLDTQRYVQLQVQAARLYGLSRDEFDHVLGTFPLIAEELRQACSRMFRSSSKAP
jgi:hypothetical protein